MFFFISICMVYSLLNDINMILFLIFNQQAQHKSGCNMRHTQIFSENLMTCGYWNSNFLCYFKNVQTIIGTNHFPNFTYSSFFYVEGHPKSIPSSNKVWPSLKHLYHSWVCVLLMASSPKACFNILKVSENVFLNLKQNFIQTCCSWKSPTLNHRNIHRASMTCIHCNRHSTKTKQIRMIQFVAFT